MKDMNYNILWLDDDFVSWFCKALDGISDTFYDSRDIGNPIPFYFPKIFV